MINPIEQLSSEFFGNETNWPPQVIEEHQNIVDAINTLYALEPFISETDSSVDIQRSVTLICTNSSAANAVLNTSPINGENAIIKRTDAQVTAIGNIDGVVNYVLSADESLRLKYSSSLGYWIKV